MLAQAATQGLTRNRESMHMEDETNSEKASPPARLIQASHYRGGVLQGKIQIHASTKHGSTTIISVMPPAELEANDTLITESWMFAARNFVVVGKHDRAMKIAGNWYEVSATKPPSSSKRK